MAVWVPAMIASPAHGSSTSGVRRRLLTQCSPLITKNEPRIVPASFDFCFANLKRDAKLIDAGIVD
jgi:hypothetical protein